MPLRRGCANQQMPAKQCASSSRCPSQVCQASLGAPAPDRGPTVCVWGGGGLRQGIGQKPSENPKPSSAPNHVGAQPGPLQYTGTAWLCIPKREEAALVYCLGFSARGRLQHNIPCSFRVIHKQNSTARERYWL